MSLALAGLTVLLALGSDEGDRVVLKNGKELRGRVVLEDDKRVVLRQDHRDTALERTDVEHVESRERNLWTLLDNDASWRPFDPEKLLTLLAQAQEMGLHGEAQVYAWREILGGTANTADHELLGHRKRGQGWVLPVGSRWVDWEKRNELAKDWGTAWTFSTLHYEVRSNLPLATLLDAVLDIERVYRAFYVTFGAELGVYDVCHPMKVDLHADAASYPEVSGEIGHYDPETDVLSLKADGVLDFPALSHVRTH
jgi:hypothetical protein